MQNQTNPKPLGESMAKMILVAAMIVSLGVLFGAIGYLAKNKPVKIQQPEVSITPSAEDEIYSIIETEKMVFSDLNNPFEQAVGTALFKIYPLNIDKNEFGYFEAYNNGEKIYTSGKNYNVNDLFAFEYNKNKYIIVGDYSGGAHCCTTDYIFRLDGENNLKLIDTLPLGNAISIGENNLLEKDGNLYLEVNDDRFAYFYTSYASSYSFKKYYLIAEEGLILKTEDFKENYTAEALACEKEFGTLVGSDKGKFEIQFPKLLCVTVNNILAGEEEKAWQGFNDHSVELYQPPADFNREKVMNEIQEKMSEFMVGETADWQTYRNEEYGYEIEYPNNFYADEILSNNDGGTENRNYTILRTKENYDKYKGTNSEPFYLWITQDWMSAPLEGHVRGQTVLKGNVKFIKAIMDGGSTENGSGFTSFYIANGDNIIQISTSYVSTLTDPIFDQILSTFKFTEKSETQKIKLYYYNSNYDPKFDCLAEAVLPVEREIPKTKTPIQDAINLLIKGEITEQEKSAGFSSEFPHEGFDLLGVDLKDGTLTLKFSEVPSFTSGGSCRIGLLSNEVVKTAMQFPEVKQVIFDPIEIFQP